VFGQIGLRFPEAESRPVRHRDYLSNPLLNILEISFQQRGTLSRVVVSGQQSTSSSNWAPRTRMLIMRWKNEH
jgi:hypothetical protein